MGDSLGYSGKTAVQIYETDTIPDTLISQLGPIQNDLAYQSILSIVTYLSVVASQYLSRFGT